MLNHQKNEIIRLTHEYGGDWALNHSRRLLHLIEEIAVDLPFDREIIWLAAYLHDWGAYAPWAQPGVDHALRSKDVAETFLVERGFHQLAISRVLECIEFHHQAGADMSREAVLLRDADALDFLGAIGILRDFSKQARDLRKGYESICLRKEKVIGIISIPKAKQIAAERKKRMDEFLEVFESETFGCF
jgi:uncharacterized protein